MRRSLRKRASIRGRREVGVNSALSLFSLRLVFFFFFLFVAVRFIFLDPVRNLQHFLAFGLLLRVDGQSQSFVAFSFPPSPLAATFPPRPPPLLSFSLCLFSSFDCDSSVRRGRAAVRSTRGSVPSVRREDPRQQSSVRQCSPDSDVAATLVRLVLFGEDARRRRLTRRCRLLHREGEKIFVRGRTRRGRGRRRRRRRCTFEPRRESRDEGRAGLDGSDRE